MQDIRYVGMIRTPSFRKAIGMFKTEGITHIQADRGIQKTIELHKLGVKAVPYLQKRERYMTDYCLNWMGPGIFSQKVLEDLIDKEELGDFVIEQIDYQFESEPLAQMLNDIVAKTCAGKKVGKIVAREKLHATFTNNCDKELKDVEFLKELNQFEIDNYRFKVSCLDLVNIHTDRVERYGEKENLDVNDATLIREVLRSLNWDGWPAEQRKYVKDGIETVPRPCAIRQYVLSDKKKWTLMGQEELNGK